MLALLQELQRLIKQQSNDNSPKKIEILLGNLFDLKEMIETSNIIQFTSVIDDSITPTFIDNILQQSTIYQTNLEYTINSLKSINEIIKESIDTDDVSDNTNSIESIDIEAIDINYNMDKELKDFLIQNIKSQRPIKSKNRLLQKFIKEVKQITSGTFVKAYDIIAAKNRKQSLKIEEDEDEVNNDIAEEDEHNDIAEEDEDNDMDNINRNRRGSWYTNEEIEFLKTIVNKDTTEITNLFNAKFKQNRSVCGIAQKISKMLANASLNKKRKLTEVTNHEYNLRQQKKRKTT